MTTKTKISNRDFVADVRKRLEIGLAKYGDARGNSNGRPLVDNPAVSTILLDIDRVFDLAEGMTGSMHPDEGRHERERIARARTEVPKMLRRLQVLEARLRRASRHPIGVIG